MPDYIIAEREAKQARRELRRLANLRKAEEIRAQRLQTAALIAGWVMALAATIQYLGTLY